MRIQDSVQDPTTTAGRTYADSLRWKLQVVEHQAACELLHRLAWRQQRFEFPYDETQVPRDGIYLLFEDGEVAHGGARIVRVGTHTGRSQLRSRVKQHFLKETKDRSIFRKNIGRCLLASRADPYGLIWESDLTSKAAQASAPAGFDKVYQSKIEREVSEILRSKFSFVAVPVPEKADRLRLETGLVSLLHACPACRPSPAWLGRHSPKPLIRESGLWQVIGLRGEPLKSLDIQALLEVTRGGA
jgi:hypothetical protein